MIPGVIGRYEVQGLLGEGAFGQVFAARDPALGRVVAIKVLRPQFSSDPSFMERFHAEAASLAALTHPNVTMIYDLLDSGQQNGMIMELVRGHTLEHVLERTRRLGLRETKAVIAQAVSGLGYIHREGVVHRDIKPANIMLTESGLLKIMDFGIARVQGAKRLTREGSIVGTLAYMAPEQIKSGQGEARSDQYSLACVAYEMLTGHPPFNADTEYDLMQAHMNAAPEPLRARMPEVPASVDQALARALAKNPADRFGSAEEFGRAFGTAEVQSQATEIAREAVVRPVGPIPPMPSRPSSVRPVSGKPAPSAASAPAKPPRGGERASVRGGKMPLFVLSGVVAAIAAFVGIIIFGGDSTPMPTPGNGKTSIASVTRPAVDSATLTPTVLQSPVVQSAGSQVAGVKLPVQQAVASVSLQKRPDLPQSSFILPNASETSREQPSPVSEPPQDVRTASASATMLVPQSQPVIGGTSPSAVPAYEGRLLDWIDGATIVLPNENGSGSRFVRLYGVRAVSGGQSEAEEYRGRLNAFIAGSGGKVSCFTPEGVDPKHPSYQCFVDRQDIARWAVEHHLARPAPDAPRDYREARQ